jgi:cellulose synthase/poly-beta-1,6-N-acetylglucosamine synthase-like glycosyltransferase
VVKQTKLPEKWVIVSDGGADEQGISYEYIAKYPFIEYVSLPDRGFRNPGQGVVETFYQGFKQVEELDYDIISKFDADLEFPPDSLEKICKAFENDQYLGITGGAIYERKKRQGPYEILKKQAA